MEVDMPELNLHIESELGGSVSEGKSGSRLSTLRMLGKLSEKSDALDKSNKSLASATSNLDTAISKLENMSSVKIAAWKAQRWVAAKWNSFGNKHGGSDGNA